MSKQGSYEQQHENNPDLGVHMCVHVCLHHACTDGYLCDLPPTCKPTHVPTWRTTRGSSKSMYGMIFPMTHLSAAAHLRFQHEINLVQLLQASKRAAKRAAYVADQITPYVADQTFCLKLSHDLIFF